MVKLGEIIFRRLSEIFRELHKERKEWCSGISFYGKLVILGIGINS